MHQPVRQMTAQYGPRPLGRFVALPGRPCRAIPATNKPYYAYAPAQEARMPKFEPTLEVLPDSDQMGEGDSVFDMQVQHLKDMVSQDRGQRHSSTPAPSWFTPVASTDVLPSENAGGSINQIPRFSGRHCKEFDSLDTGAWLCAAEQYFMSAGIRSNLQKITLASAQLKDDALLWWQSRVKAAGAYPRGPGLPKTWASLANAIEARYPPAPVST